jgi:hypothetical protein
MDVIYCAGGGKILAKIAIEEGFLYGSRSDDIRPEPRCNGLIDINWENYNWLSHLEAVRSHRPKYAVVPDITQLREYSRVLRLAIRVEPFCQRVIVVPKVDSIIKCIPRKYIIGISVPTSYSGFLPKVDELKGREIHLLGGSPGQQRELWKYFRSMGISILSVDVNTHNKVSNFGNYWNGNKWVYEGRYKLDKYQAFRKSCKGIINMWRKLGAL